MTSIKMDEATKAKWVPALEGGSYKQAVNRLYDGLEGYCCLGVLCRVKGATFSCPSVEDDNGEMVPDTDEPLGAWLDYTRIDGGYGLLDAEYAASLGLTKAHQDLLTGLNDGATRAIANDDPLIEVWRKVAREEVDFYGGRTFVVRRHSFIEIAAVIREYF